MKPKMYSWLTVASLLTTNNKSRSFLRKADTQWHANKKKEVENKMNSTINGAITEKYSG